jgi:aspartate--ammonia ligase
MAPGEGLVTDMRAVRKDYFLDHDHSVYVDQWDWEKVITPAERSLEFLTKTVEAIWKVIRSAEDLALDLFPALEGGNIPRLPEN